jgi:hypothetical protein
MFISFQTLNTSHHEKPKKSHLRGEVPSTEDLQWLLYVKDCCTGLDIMVRCFVSWFISICYWHPSPTQTWHKLNGEMFCCLVHICCCHPPATQSWLNGEMFLLGSCLVFASITNTNLPNPNDEMFRCLVHISILVFASITYTDLA